MDVFTYWQRAAAANVSLATSTARFAEAFVAAASVMRVRLDLIGAGMRSPLDTDWREMERMVSEKTTAFGKAGEAATARMGTIQAKLSGDWQEAFTLPLAAVTPAKAAHAQKRLAMIALDMLEETARLAEAALEPIHKAVTANARRLG